MIEKKRMKGVRMNETLISKIEKYANDRSLTFSAAVVQLIFKALEKEGKKK